MIKDEDVIILYESEISKLIFLSTAKNSMMKSKPFTIAEMVKHERV